MWISLLSIFWIKFIKTIWRNILFACSVNNYYFKYCWALNIAHISSNHIGFFSFHFIGFLISINQLKEISVQFTSIKLHSMINTWQLSASSFKHWLLHQNDFFSLHCMDCFPLSTKIFQQNKVILSLTLTIMQNLLKIKHATVDKIDISTKSL